MCRLKSLALVFGELKRSDRAVDLSDKSVRKRTVRINDIRIVGVQPIPISFTDCSGAGRYNKESFASPLCVRVRKNRIQVFVSFGIVIKNERDPKRSR